MKSKAGNKLKKIRKLTLAAVALTGCITEPRTIQQDYEVPATCMVQPDSSTWTDTTQTDDFSCRIGPSTNPIPPSLK